MAFFLLCSIHYFRFGCFYLMNVFASRFLGTCGHYCSFPCCAISFSILHGQDLVHTTNDDLHTVDSNIPWPKSKGNQFLMMLLLMTSDLEQNVLSSNHDLLKVTALACENVSRAVQLNLFSMMLNNCHSKIFRVETIFLWGAVFVLNTSNHICICLLHTCMYLIMENQCEEKWLFQQWPP